MVQMKWPNQVLVEYGNRIVVVCGNGNYDVGAMSDDERGDGGKFVVDTSLR